MNLPELLQTPEKQEHPHYPNTPGKVSLSYILAPFDKDLSNSAELCAKKGKLDKEGQIATDKAQADSHLENFIVNSSHPFSVVKQNGLIEFWNEFNETYKEPMHASIRETSIHRHRMKKGQSKGATVAEHGLLEPANWHVGLDF